MSVLLPQWLRTDFVFFSPEDTFRSRRRSNDSLSPRHPYMCQLMHYKVSLFFKQSHFLPYYNWSNYNLEQFQRLIFHLKGHSLLIFGKNQRSHSENGKVDNIKMRRVLTICVLPICSKCFHGSSSAVTSSDFSSHISSQPRLQLLSTLPPESCISFPQLAFLCIPLWFIRCRDLCCNKKHLCNFIHLANFCSASTISSSLSLEGKHFLSNYVFLFLGPYLPVTLSYFKKLGDHYTPVRSRAERKGEKVSVKMITIWVVKQHKSTN